jgi:3-oxoacyl-[acyl-carrier protein] reductase
MTLVDERPFAGKVVLVTGASRGIGRAIAERFAAGGATIAVHYRANESAARVTFDALPEGRHVLVRGDVGDPTDAARIVAETVEQLETVDVLVNNAGVYLRHHVVDVSYADWQDAWQETLATNLVGPANLIHQVVPHMLRHGGGRIVNVSSRGAFRGEPEHPAYGASKAGLNSMGQSLAQLLAPHGIYVTTVAPGWVMTDMTRHVLERGEGEAVRAQTPLHRAATADEVARVVVFLATPGTEYATGAIVDVNGASYLRT